MADLQIVIVGAGIAGLATAISLAQKTRHRILILESSKTLTEAGAGLQVTSNASRMLCNWGLRDKFESIATVPDHMEIRRYDDNELFGLVPSNTERYAERVWGYPHWLVHRVDCQKALSEVAQEAGVQLRFGAKVVDVDVDACTLTLEGGETVAADLVVGADGIHSRTRRSMPAVQDIRPTRAVNYCYRVLIPRDKMLSDPLTAPLMQERKMTWPGPMKHIIAYPVSNGQFYNLVMTIPDLSDAPLGQYNQPGDLDEMRREFAGWNDTVAALLRMADTCAKWTIAELPPLPTWRTPNGRVVLLGDAAHAMTPHAASGAATTFEDAEVLGHCLADCTTVDDLADAAQVYEHLRKARCEKIAAISRQNATTFSMPNGPEQEARDQKFSAAKKNLEKELAGEVPLTRFEADMDKPYPHPALVMWLYGYDATTETQKYLESAYAA